MTSWLSAQRWSAVRAGRLDLLEPPVAPLDVLAQQLVAEVASVEEYDVEALWQLVRHSAPYAELERTDFDEVVELVSWGIETGRGRRGAHLHHDAVNGRLRARRGARLAGPVGGAIPETGDYRVGALPEGITVGSVHEDFAVEAMAGDIFVKDPFLACGQGRGGNGPSARRRGLAAHRALLAG